MGIMWDIENLAGAPQTGIRVDTVEDTVDLIHTQDVQPIIDLNKKLYNDFGDGYGPTREWRRAASIPNIILEKWNKEEGIRWWDSEDSHLLVAKLNDPEWKFLRTAPGHLGRKPFRKYFRASTGSVV